jgi:hypothetical protein
MSQSCRISSVERSFAFGPKSCDGIVVALMHRVLVLAHFVMGFNERLRPQTFDPGLHLSSSVELPLQMNMQRLPIAGKMSQG